MPHQSARAATATGTLGVSLTVSSGCSVGASTAVAFGTTVGLTSAQTANGTIFVTCTNTTPYTVSLDAGGGGSATTTNRKLTGTTASNTVTYHLYKDNGLSSNFGNTAGTDTLTGQTGSGSAQPITVYGQVPANSAAAADTYSDTVGITITY